MKKFKYFLDDEKEEQWINDMATQGWHLRNYNLLYYTFEKGEPGEYTYRCDFLDNLGFGKSAKAYIEFVESTGAELVYKNLQWVYFRQHRDLGEFELYSDGASKLGYINRLFLLYVAIAVINLIGALANGGLFLADNELHFNHFISGVNMGIFAVLLIATAMLWIRRKNLKKRIELYEI